MTCRTRFLNGVVLTVTAVAVLTAAPGAQARLPLLRPGTSDFGAAASNIGSPPNVADAARLARPEKASAVTSGFRWGELGIGIVLGIVVAALCAGLLVFAVSAWRATELRPTRNVTD